MDPAKMKVVDLRSELGALGLDTKGNKPALVERLKKALESKTGKSIPDSSILDTSTEMDDEGTPRKGPAAPRTRRRSSSARLLNTPIKPRKEREASPEPIKEAKEEDGSERYSPQPDSDSNSMPEKDRTPEREVQKSPEKPSGSDDDRSQSPEAPAKTTESVLEPAPESVPPTNSQDDKQDEKMSEDTPKDGEEKPAKMDVDEDQAKPEDDKRDEDKRERKRELTEEEEWAELNERLRIRENERLELEKQHAEEDARKLEALKEDPVKLNRLKRKQEKKARWSNFYKTVEVTSEVLTPPVEEDYRVETKKGKKDTAVETKVNEEPEIDDNKVTLSWYDSDLNQYIEVPDLASVFPLSDGVFSHAWAGARATHGVTAGRVVYEVRVGAAVTTTEAADKDSILNGIRVGWSTDDSSLHLGEGELSWGYESTGRIVHNSEFKEYGKQLNEKDVIGVYLDLESSPCKMFYTVNSVELGTAFEFDKATLEGKPLFPHILTKNQCYKVNFGYDRYNMITKTKIVRNRIEIPIEKVLEEKKAREAELQRQKDEAIRREKERKEKEKQEREERQRKRKEERERQEKEKKEREAQERRDRGEPDPEPEPEKDDQPKEPEKDEQSKEPEKAEPTAAEPKENGDKPQESVAPAEVKTEPMEVEGGADKPKEAEGEVPEVTEEQVFQGHVLDKRIKFVTRYTVAEELDGAEACMVPGYLHIAHAAALAAGPRRPDSIAECEVILMVGMPGVGKTYWAREQCAKHPHKRYNIISTGALFDRMKVDCKPFRSTFEGKWDAMVSKCAKCVLKLLETARGRRRHFILDQTNVYPSAQRRKLKEFEGYRRVVCCLVTDAETMAERREKQDSHDSKEVPDPAIMDMKANFSLPEKCQWIDEVIFPELDEEEAKAVIEGYHKEAKAAGVLKEKDKRDRSASRDGPPQKRHKPQDKRHGRDDRGRSRDFQRDREDRWGGGGGSRWGGGGGGGGGSRWGRDRPPQGGGGRFDRWSQPRGDFNRDRDSFRGRGGMGGPPRGDRGPGMPGRGPPPSDRGGFGRDNRGPRGPPHTHLDNRDKRPPQGPPPQGAGSWQRGGQVANNARGGGPRPPLTSRPPPIPNQKPIETPVTMNAKPTSLSNDSTNNQNQQGWNQWGGNWGGGWGSWNQNQQAAAGWGNWGNWGNWNSGQNQPNQPNQQQGAGNNAVQQQNKGQAASAQQPNQQQWANNYTAQQWYQWQQWQQQQQAWQQQGYGQGQTGNQQQQQPTAQEAQQAWAQYYQNYGANAAASTGTAVTGTDKKT